MKLRHETAAPIGCKNVNCILHKRMSKAKTRVRTEEWNGIWKTIEGLMELLTLESERERWENLQILAAFIEDLSLLSNRDNSKPKADRKVLPCR